MSEKVLGSYGQPTPPQNTSKPKSLVVNPRSFIGGGINKGIPPYLIKDEQWLDSLNMVFDFEKAFALSPRMTVDSFVATPSDLQPGTMGNRILPQVPLPDVPRTGQQPGDNYQAYPDVPVYDHSQGPNPEPSFDPLDPYKALGQPPVIQTMSMVIDLAPPPGGIPGNQVFVATDLGNYVEQSEGTVSFSFLDQIRIKIICQSGNLDAENGPSNVPRVHTIIPSFSYPVKCTFNTVSSSTNGPLVFSYSISTNGAADVEFDLNNSSVVDSRTLILPFQLGEPTASQFGAGVGSGRFHTIGEVCTMELIVDLQTLI